jgi:hypothetical protein
LVIYDQGATKNILNVFKLMGKHLIDPKSSEILSIFQVFPCTTQIALFWPKLLPAFSVRSLDIPALLKSWKKHYITSKNLAEKAEPFHYSI